ncbi:hypothetical protein AB6A40_010919 [Gnathostoma spinigerum]|uniref:Uncharacterized protein n=1 Tax=Gnathostoma spinigerum TaxID=75299 RepID=A0ABD6F446_9BILA
MISASANSDSHLHRLAKLPTLVVQRSLSAKKEHKHKETLLIRTITAVFRKWGYFVADHIILLIALSLLMSALCAIIVFRTPYKNDLLGFVPYGAPSRYEIDVKNEFEDSRGRGILILIMLKPKDEGNAMRPEILKEAIEIDNIVMNNITIRNRKSGRLQTYSDICTHYCVLDEPMKIFVNAYLLQLELLKEDGRPNENLILNYPVMSVYGRKLNIQLYFGGVKLSDDVPLVDALDDTTNLTTFTNIRSAKIISLVYRTELVEGLTEAEVTKYELDVVDYFQT